MQAQSFIILVAINFVYAYLALDVLASPFSKLLLFSFEISFVDHCIQCCNPITEIFVVSENKVGFQIVFILWRF